MSKLNIKPLADRVLIEPAAAETKTSSGIIIPDSAKEKPQKGTVVAVGKGTKENPITVKLEIKFYMVNMPELSFNMKDRTT